MKNSPPLIPHGALVRTTWPDENAFDPDTTSVAGDWIDDWTSPGVTVVLRTSDINQLLGKGKEPYPSFELIPHGVKGLLVVNHQWYDINHIQDDLWPFYCIWYQVIYKEKTVWIHGKNIILEKTSTQF